MRLLTILFLFAVVVATLIVNPFKKNDWFKNDDFNNYTDMNG